MSNFSERISKLSPEKRKIFEEKLKHRSMDISRIPIVSLDKEIDKFPLSYAQQRLWVLNQYDPDDSSYNMITAVEISGNIDVKGLENSINEIIKRHDTLRTKFISVEGVPYQVVQEFLEITLAQEDIQSHYINNSEKFVHEYIAEDAREVFDLKTGPLIRGKLYKLNSQKYILSIVVHHIVSDGWSTGIMVKELLTFYKNYCQAEISNLPKLPIQYKDYSCWQNQWLKGNMLEKDIKYWKEKLRGAPYAINLPTDFVRPVKSTHKGKRQVFHIEKNIIDELNTISKHEGVTLFMTILAVLKILLNQYTSQDDILIATPIAGRNRYEIEPLIGFFVNILILRTNFKDDMLFSELLRQISKTSVDAYAHQNLSYEKLIDEICPDRDMNFFPFSQVMFIYQNSPMPKIELNNINIKPLKIESGCSKVDLTFEIIEDDDGMDCIIEYSTELFRDSTIRRMKEHFIFLLKTVIEKKDIRISQMPLISEVEYNWFLNEWNSTYRDYNNSLSIHSMFRKQVEKTPNATALIYNDKIVNYMELEQESNRLARYLIRLGVGVGSFIGVCMERSFDCFVAILGVLKAGCVYVPLDISYPLERIKFMIKDSGIDIIITRSCYKDNLTIDEISLVYMDSDWDKIKLEDSDYPNIENHPEDIAYMIYTSGSTGVPKGVLATNKNALNRFSWMWEAYPFEKDDVLCHKTSLSFVDSIWEIFGGLLKGIPTVIIPDEVLKNPLEFIHVLNINMVTRIVLVPSLMRIILDLEDNLHKKLSNIRLWVLSGEELTVDIVWKFRKVFFNAKLINLYGSSEVSADVTYYDTSNLNREAYHVPIGKPISNTRIYILDKYMRQVPIGIYGEIYISGIGVASGYLNRDEMTFERFVEDQYNREENRRMFKTGDIGRYLLDGNIEFAGRRDKQVKIRGIRVELSEIERALLKYKNIKEAVVLLHGREEKYICAYVVKRKEIDELELKEYLSEVLLEYMIPSHIILIDKLPLLPNGKINSKLLPSLSRNYLSQREFQVPTNEVEEKLSVIWSKILDVDTFSINDNFFEIGGNSLKCMQLVAIIHKEFNKVLPINVLFKRRTIKELAQYIINTKESTYLPIEKVEEKEFYPLSSAQKRLFIINHLEGASIKYNLPNIMKLEGYLDYDRFNKVFKKLVSRHESLRTSFEMNGLEPVQRVHKEVIFEVDFEEKKEYNLEKLINSFIRAFDLSKAPLIRVKLVKISDNIHILLFDMHHIISDGTSVDILINEFIRLYKNLELKEMKIDYKDFSSWQNNILKSDEIKKQGEYWQKQFEKDIPVINLPLDYPRPLKQNFEGSCLSFTFNKEKSASLYDFANNNGVTLYMLLLAIYNVLLSKYSGQEDIVIGSPVAGRRHPDLDNVIGVFINTLAIRNYPTSNKSFKQFLNEVKETTLISFENQDYPFEDLIAKLDLARDMQRNPLFDVMLILHNNKIKDFNMDNLSITHYQSQFNISKFDITLNAVERNGEIHFDLEYCRNLFKKETMQRFVEHFINIIDEVIINPNVYLSSINMISQDETKRILQEFNNTQYEYHKNKTISEMFETQVEDSPDDIAIIYNDISLNYSELNRRVNSFANLLRIHGVKPNDIIGVMVNRSDEMLTIILGILKAGGAYLPIDPQYPVDRIEHMLSDSGASILVTDKTFINKFDFNGDKIYINDKTIFNRNYSKIQNVNSSKDLAYVIYTSGSTGKPKGVMIEHRAVNNFIEGIAKIIDFNSSKTILALTTVSFDIFVLESLLPLVKGMKVVIADEKHQMDMKLLNELIIKNNVNMIQMTPSRLQLMIENFSSKATLENINEIMVGGEAFPAKLLENVKKLYKGKIYNMYGPTEATVWSTVKNLTNSDRITIGTPIANTQIYILSKDLKIVPIGIPGELYIGGDGLSKGYLDKLDLTNERFIKNPYRKGELIYRTGDLARWLENGELEFIGRVDNQVKIRGYRIEFGEIESFMTQFAGIKEAIVNKTGNDDKSYLCGYFVSAEKVDIVKLREFLSNKLPTYMIPQYFVQIDEMPLTPNKKINRTLLPNPTENISLKDGFIAPEGEIEKQISLIWQKILKSNMIGVNDNFFELGGNSVLLMQMHSQVDCLYPGKVDISDIFGYPTISKIAKFIERNNRINNTISINYISLPKEYFCLNSSNSLDGMMKFNISKELYSCILRLAERIGVNIQHVLLSIYIYLLSSISREKKVCIYAILIGQSKPFRLESDLDSSEFDNFEDYIKYIKRKCEISLDNNNDIEYLSNKGLLKNNNEILPLFCSSYSIGNWNNMLSVFDLIFEFTEDKHEASFLCEYNGKRLNKEKIKEFIEEYMDLLITILDNF